MDKTLYDLIGVVPQASSEEIESACIELGRRLASEKSTDIDAEYKFAELERAYEVLGNPDKRRKYDSTIGIASDGSDTGNGEKKSHPRWLLVTLAVARTLRRYPRALALAGLFFLLVVVAYFGPRIYARWQIYRADISYSQLAFSVAVSKERSDVVALFLQAGMDADTPMADVPSTLGYTGTGLGYAAGRTDIETARVLLKWGANPNLPSGRDKRTPLESLFFSNSAFLLAKQSDPKPQDYDSALFLLRQTLPLKEAEETARILSRPMTYGKFLSSEEKASNRSRLLPMVELLIANGAVPNFRDAKWLSQTQKLLTREDSIAMTGDDQLYLTLEQAANLWNKQLVRIEPDCTVNGLGTATCTFRNKGTSSANTCIRLVLESPNTRFVKVHSSEICSGQVAPNDVRQITQRVPFVDSNGNPVTPVEGCRLYDNDTSDWRLYCNLVTDVSMGAR